MGIVGVILVELIYIVGAQRKINVQNVQIKIRYLIRATVTSFIREEILQEE